MKYHKAIIFDFDGTVVDTEPLHGAAHIESFREKGVEIDYQHYLDHFAGQFRSERVMQLFEEHGKPITWDEVEAMHDKKTESYGKLDFVNMCSYPGVIDLIKQALDNDIQIAICSGSPRKDFYASFEHIDKGELHTHFNHIVLREDVQQPKPDPEGFLLAAARLQLDPADCIAIEDSPAGVTAAKAAGMHTIAVTNTHNASQLQHADLVVDSLEGVLAKLAIKVA